MFLLSEVILYDVFGDAIQPGIESGLTTEGLDTTKGTKPCVLGQVFCDFGVFDATADMTIEAVLILADDRGKGFGLSLLRARDEVFVVER